LIRWSLLNSKSLSSNASTLKIVLSLKSKQWCILYQICDPKVFAECLQQEGQMIQTWGDEDELNAYDKFLTYQQKITSCLRNIAAATKPRAK